MRGKRNFRSGIRDQDEDSQLGEMAEWSQKMRCGDAGLKKPISDPL